MSSLSVDDVSVSKTALAASAEAATKTVKITASGGVDEVPGTWSDDKVAMERQLGGAVVLFNGSALGPRVFGTIPASGAFRVKEGKLQVKISKEGTTHGNWHDSDMLASDTSATIWL